MSKAYSSGLYSWVGKLAPIAIALIAVTGCSSSEGDRRTIATAGGSAGSASGSGTAGTAGTGGSTAGTSATGVMIGGTNGVIPTVNCGNGVLDMGEECDDGNKVNGDGCNMCQLAAGWVCPTPGMQCQISAVCGNGKLEGDEVCDDGNTTGMDGCAADCKSVDTGYECRVPGRKCVPACGDGLIIGTEKCDDGNTTNGDGCSATCLVEPGASCMGMPSKCSVAVCGNGIKEEGEGCDVGVCPSSTGTTTLGMGMVAAAIGKPCNGLFYGDATGCSKTCTQEPVCRGMGAAPTMGTTHECAVTCGNGNIEMGEACDDGNTAAGDGCSPTCTIEPGFTCSAEMKADTEACPGGQCLELPVIYRDFKDEKESGGHPDFFYHGAPITGGPSITGVASQPGAITYSKRYCVPNSGGPAKKNDSTARAWDIATPALDAHGKPAFNAARTNGTMADCQFTDWSHDTNGGHVPGYDAVANGPLNGLTYNMGPSGHPQYKGLAPIVTSAASFGQWYNDSTFTKAPTATAAGQASYVGRLELSPMGTLYQFSSTPHPVYGGFFPLDSLLKLNAYPLTGGTAAPGAMTAKNVGTAPMDTGEPMQCNLWPYWYSSASFGAGAGCKGDQYMTPPNLTPEGWVTQMQGWFHDSWFTTEARYLFVFNGAFSLQFYGDDDTFVYINGKLVIDLGGVHQRLPGAVNVSAAGMAAITEGGSLTGTTITACPGTDPVTMVATTSPADCRTRTVDLGLTMGKTYEIAVFGADRGAAESNFQLTLSGFATSKSNCAPRCGDGVVTGAEECDCGDTTASTAPECQINGMASTNNDTTYGGCTTMCKNGPYCGDGNVDTSGMEECDKGSKNNTGSYGVKNGCTPGCKLTHYCGDGVLDANETCDLGDGVNGMPGVKCSAMCSAVAQ